jgi:tripartite ATP-independent transporter DctM subunit
MEYLPLFMIFAMFVFVFLGMHVAFALAGTALMFGYAVFEKAVIYQFMEKIEDIASNYVLAAVPLFVFMGTMLERSGIADKLFEAVHLWTRRLPGGLALGTVLMCVIFAASTGVIGATETVVGLLAIPIMLKYAYNKPLICGTICAGGSLGTIIPPSVVVVVLGPVANVSVGDLMVGMLFPGLIMAGLYLVYIFLLCLIRPEYGPRIPPSADEPPLMQRLRFTAYALLPPLLMIFAVLGSLMLGWAAPTEAAALGAFGSILLTLFYGKFTRATLRDSILKTLRITSMIMAILLGGMLFTGVFFAAGGINLTTQLVSHLNLNSWALLFLLLAICLVAGFVLDWISILLIFIPIFMPLVVGAGFNPVWFCILFLIVIQTSYLTPPMAPAIFYLRGISPPTITLLDMYKGVIPFIVLQLVALAIVMIFPETVLWLPSKLLGNR